MYDEEIRSCFAHMQQHAGGRECLCEGCNECRPLDLLRVCAPSETRAASRTYQAEKLLTRKQWLEGLVQALLWATRQALTPAGPWAVKGQVRQGVQDRVFSLHPHKYVARVASVGIRFDRETNEKARQPETKLGAIAQTRHTARLRNAKRSQTKHIKPTHGARDRHKQAWVYMSEQWDIVLGAFERASTFKLACSLLSGLNQPTTKLI
jgi:hypothetical protein